MIAQAGRSAAELDIGRRPGFALGVLFFLEAVLIGDLAFDEARAPNRLFLLEDVVGAVAMAGVPPYSSEAAFDADTAAAPHASLETVQRARCSGSMSAPWSSRRSDTRPMGRMIYA